ncbi:hypothetical protein QWF21_18065, partial [Alkalimonas sp. MEB004]
TRNFLGGSGRADWAHAASASSATTITMRATEDIATYSATRTTTGASATSSTAATRATAVATATGVVSTQSHITAGRITYPAGVALRQSQHIATFLARQFLRYRRYLAALYSTK